MGSNEETKSESGDLIHEVICKDSCVGSLLSAKMASLYISPPLPQITTYKDELVDTHKDNYLDTDNYSDTYKHNYVDTWG